MDQKTTLVAIEWEQGEADWEKYPKRITLDTKQISLSELREFVLGFQPERNKQ